MGGGRSMGGPASMRNASEPSHLIGGHLCFELRDPLCAAGAPQPSLVKNSNAAGVVSSIFQSLESLDQHWHHISLSDRPDNPAHHRSPCLFLDCRLDSRKLNFNFLMNLK